jgi:beta-1,4-galactosyltransferase 3
MKALIYSFTDYSNIINENSNIEFEDISQKLDSLQIKLEPGGISYTQANSNCFSKINIAFIIPYRNRLQHLKVFLNNMHPYFTRQQYNYGIYVVEPVSDVNFNRGLLMNAGFKEALLDQKNINLNWTCFILHDVDMMPEDERLIYECDPQVPLHIAVAVKKFGYM